MAELKIIKTVGDYSLVQKGSKYYIDNGVDDVSEYMDEYDAKYLLEAENEDFLELAKEYFD